MKTFEGKLVSQNIYDTYFTIFLDSVLIEYNMQCYRPYESMMISIIRIWYFRW